MMMRKLHTWPVSWILMIILLLSLPYLVALIFTPPGLSFVGILDFSGYTYDQMHLLHLASRGEMGAPGFTLNQNYPVYHFNLLFYVLGNISSALHMNPILVFQLSRFLFLIIVLVLIYRLICFFLEDTFRRKLAFVFICVYSGLNYYGKFSRDFTIDEIFFTRSSVIESLYANTLVAAALVLMLGGLYLLLLADRSNRPKYYLPALVIFTALAAIYPISLLSVMAVWSTYVLIRYISSSLKADIRHPKIIPSFSILLPGFVYLFLHVRGSFDITYHKFSYESIPFGLFLTELGPFILVILISTIAFMRYRTETPEFMLGENPNWMTRSSAFMIIWAVLGIIFTIIPHLSSMSIGYGIPVGLAAAYGTKYWIGNKNLRLKAFVLTITFIVALPGTLLIVGRDMKRIYVLYPRAPRPLIRDYEMAPVLWIKNNTNLDEKIMVSPCTDLNLYIPLVAGNMVYQRPENTADTKRFFDKNTPDSWRKQFLIHENIKYIVSCSSNTEPFSDLHEKSYLKTVIRSPQIVPYIYVLKFKP